MPRPVPTAPRSASSPSVAEKSAPTAVAAGFAPWQDTVRAVIADMDAVIADLKAAIDGLDEFDLTSQDIAIAIMQTIEKDRWFLFAHVAE